jgi:alcohol dehydrogenase YqhD (iron-dependent ADH family)
MDSTWAIGRTVVFGWDTFHLAPERIARVGRRPLILAGRSSARRLGHLSTLLTGLDEHGCAPVVFEGIASEPRSDVVDKAASLALREGCDVVVGLGGGSVLDSAKAVAATARTGTKAWDIVAWGRSDQCAPAECSDLLPVACIPTIASSGSEANGTGVLRHPSRREKGVFFDDRLRPCVAVVDPSLSITVDPLHTLAGAADIVAHGIEDWLTSECPDSAQELRCLELARTALEMAEQAARNLQSPLARTTLAHLAMDVWNGSFSGPETPWTLHAIAHVLGAWLEAGHSMTIAWLLPGWMTFIQEKKTGRLSDLWADVQSALPQLPYSASTVSWDPGDLADIVLGIYGEDGVMPGWPGLKKPEVARILEGVRRLSH